jgi:O-methyltransferase
LSAPRPSMNISPCSMAGVGCFGSWFKVSGSADSVDRDAPGLQHPLARRRASADGQLITLEANARHARVARADFERAGHAHHIELREGPALKSLAALAAERQRFDFCFIDADKVNNPRCATERSASPLAEIRLCRAPVSCTNCSLRIRASRPPRSRWSAPRAMTASPSPKCSRIPSAGS